jgi:hypothetical protein
MNLKGFSKLFNKTSIIKCLWNTNYYKKNRRLSDFQKCGSGKVLNVMRVLLRQKIVCVFF